MSYNSNLHIFKYRRSELRNNATKPEVILWSKLKGGQCNNKKFRRQHGFGPYIVDFYCKKLGLVIELDGDTHIGKEEYDAQRTLYLEGLELKVLRFTNDQIFNNLEGVMDIISQTPPNLPFKKGRR